MREKLLQCRRNHHIKHMSVGVIGRDVTGSSIDFAISAVFALFFSTSSVSNASTLLCSFMICFERSLFSVNVTPHLEIIPSARVCFQIAGQFVDGRRQSGGHDLRWFAGTEHVENNG